MPSVKVNGAEIYYDEVGRGPAIILSPGGLQGLLEGYRPIIEGLATHHRVIAYDRRFGGQSRSPMVVQTWALNCQDVLGLMDALGIEDGYLGGGSFGPGIALGCAARHPDRVRGVFASNLAGGIICDSYLGGKLFRSLDLALSQGMKALVDAFDRDDRCAPFLPEQVLYDPEQRESFEQIEPEDYAQVMRDTIRALFDGPYVSLGMTAEMLKGIRAPTLVMPGHDDVHPREIAESVHRLIPNSRWAEVPPHPEAPDKYVTRVVQFIAEVESATSS